MTSFNSYIYRDTHYHREEGREGQVCKRKEGILGRGLYEAVDII